MEQGAIVLIPIEDIHILNPRVRNQIIAEENTAKHFGMSA